MKKNTHRVKNSISRQIAATFIILLAALLVMNMIFNYCFLGKFYQHKLQKSLISVYREVNENVTNSGISDKLYSSEFAEECDANNINLVILDSNFQTVLGQSDIMMGRLFGYITNLEHDDAKVLRRTDNYTIQLKTDQVMNMEYLEMWGQLDNSYYFLMRIPMASVRLSSSISNEFSLYISLLAAVISIFLVNWLSERIAKPIRELSYLSKRMANLDFDAKYVSGGDNEIGRLGENFNQMSKTLETTISRLKSANYELQRDIEQKNKNEQMKNEFIANVSHELKTPLALISGYAEGLKDCVNDDPESRDYYCDVIIDESAKMTSMVRKLLTLNELEYGRDKIELKRFDLAQLVRNKVEASRILAQGKEAQITYYGPEELHAWGDEFKVEEILTNYISNAINHVEGEKKISVNCEVRGGKVRTSVYNTGRQIPEEDLNRIWDKFFKVDKAHSREYGGSGVGLSIVKTIMDSFRQKYGVKNHEDGVEFWFELDVAEGELIDEEKEM